MGYPRHPRPHHCKTLKTHRYSSMRRLLYDMSGDVKNFKCFFSKLYALEDEGTNSYETLENSYTVMQIHIPEQQNPQTLTFIYSIPG